jgi:beta-galactosidase
MNILSYLPVFNFKNIYRFSHQKRKREMNGRQKHIFISATLVFVFCLSSYSITFSNDSRRITFNFNPRWLVHVGDVKGADAIDFNDSQWKNVTLPYAWNEDDAFRKDIHDLSTGIVWYRKHFKIPSVHQGKKVFLEFEGIRQGGEFYLNGEFIGRHENGVMAVGLDITGLVRLAPEENVLAVRTDNDWNYREKFTGQEFQWNDNNFNANYGGIPKNVRLHLADQLYQTLPLFTTLGTTGVYVYARDINIPGKSALVTAESQVKNEYPVAKTFHYEVRIEDMDGNLVKTFAGHQATVTPGGVVVVQDTATVTGLDFWSWGYGYLYNVITTLAIDSQPVDQIVTRTGFRKTEFGNGMIKLNDRVLMVKGYAQRTSNEWPAVGMSVPPWMSDFSNRMIVEGNGDLVRWMHVTPWKQDVESCDRAGLIEAMPAGDAERDVFDRRWDQRVELMRDAIIYNRNNPSILFYEGGNKGISEEHIQELKNIRDQYDPYGGRAIGSREMLGSRVAEYGGEMLYINKSARKPLWAMEYSRDEGLRKYWDEFSPPSHKDGDGPLYRNHPANEYNRNQDSHAIEDIVRWYDYWRERPGTGRRVSSGGVNIIFSDTNTHFRGAENYRRSGEVDPMRIPKDGYFANQVMWDGWVNVEYPRIHIMGHWNYAPGTTKNIYVVSSADKVELFINGQSQGFGEQSYGFLYTFKDIIWQPGVIKAIGYDAEGNTLCESEIKTVGEPARIRLTVHTGPAGLQANGADLALVDVEVVDAQGERNPVAFNMIDFTLEGPAEWRGGIAQGPDNYILAKSLPVELGVNRVIIRSTTTAGKIRLSAKSAGLQPAFVEIESRPVKVVDGLSTAMPDSGLPSYLDRGPTPATPSFTGMTRKPVNIVSAQAGANSDQTGQSYDDNEETDWHNDGKIETAWIEYDFVEPAAVNEVTVKLGGWRQHFYPLRISVDGTPVFSGTSWFSLGYITIPVKPVLGKRLKIELTGHIVDQNGQAIKDTYNPRDAAASCGRHNGLTLNIVEIEFYEKN